MEQRLDIEKFRDNRLKSQAQREKIVLDSYFKGWKKSDATKTTVVERTIGAASLPIFGIWGVFLGFISLGIGMAVFILKIIGSLARGK